MKDDKTQDSLLVAKSSAKVRDYQARIWYVPRAYTWTNFMWGGTHYLFYVGAPRFDDWPWCSPRQLLQHLRTLQVEAQDFIESQGRIGSSPEGIYHYLSIPVQGRVSFLLMLVILYTQPENASKSVATAHAKEQEFTLIADKNFDDQAPHRTLIEEKQIEEKEQTEKKSVKNSSIEVIAELFQLLNLLLDANLDVTLLYQLITQQGYCAHRNNLSSVTEEALRFSHIRTHYIKLLVRLAHAGLSLDKIHDCIRSCYVTADTKKERKTFATIVSIDELLLLMAHDLLPKDQYEKISWSQEALVSSIEKQSIETRVALGKKNTDPESPLYQFFPALAQGWEAMALTSMSVTFPQIIVDPAAGAADDVHYFVRLLIELQRMTINAGLSRQDARVTIRNFLHPCDSQSFLHDCLRDERLTPLILCELLSYDFLPSTFYSHERIRALREPVYILLSLRPEFKEYLKLMAHPFSPFYHFFGIAQSSKYLVRLIHDVGNAAQVDGKPVHADTSNNSDENSIQAAKQAVVDRYTIERERLNKSTKPAVEKNNSEEIQKWLQHLNPWISNATELTHVINCLVTGTLPIADRKCLLLAWLLTLPMQEQNCAFAEIQKSGTQLNTFFLKREGMLRTNRPWLFQVKLLQSLNGSSNASESSEQKATLS